MTGATILFAGKGRLVLTKVRHDGGDAVQYLKRTKKTGSPLAMARKFHRWWDGRMACPGEEIRTKYPEGFHARRPKACRRENLNELFPLTVALLENAVERMAGKEDGLLCGYTDYEVLVNTDTGKVRVME